MPSPARILAPLALVGVVSAAGCHLLIEGAPPTKQSLLNAARAADDAVTFEFYWVELPEDADSSEELLAIWNEVHEHRLPVDLRDRLSANGLRAGVVGAKAPDGLLRMLDPQGKSDLSMVGLSDLAETGVRRRTRQMRPGESIELNASQVAPESPLLISRDGKVKGTLYTQAQGVYVLEVGHSSDERVKVRMRPEVRHGEQQLRFISDDTGAITRGSLKRAAEEFEDLAIETELAAGEMLLVTGLPDSGSRLGELFHEQSGRRKAMLVRLAQAPQTTAFAVE